MHEKTVIAIAHRLSTLRAMDRIVVIEQVGSSRTRPRRAGAAGRCLRQPVEQQVSGFIPD